MNIKPETLESWIKFIRFHSDLAESYMDCFWLSQLKSKEHLLDALDEIATCNRDPNLGNVFIFGGWYGVTSQLIMDSLDFTYESIHSIDINPVCSWVFSDVIKAPNTYAVTANCADYKYPQPPNIVINTVTEHLTQSDYDSWWNNIPIGTEFILQGNDYFEHHEHIRCAKNTDEFLAINKVTEYHDKLTWSFSGPDDKLYNRFMVWGSK